jgi:hypothetical protein
MTLTGPTSAFRARCAILSGLLTAAFVDGYHMVAQNSRIDGYHTTHPVFSSAIGLMNWKRPKKRYRRRNWSSCPWLEWKMVRPQLNIGMELGWGRWHRRSRRRRSWQERRYQDRNWSKSMTRPDLRRKERSLKGLACQGRYRGWDDGPLTDEIWEKHADEREKH